MKDLERMTAGIVRFGDTIDITDPGYDKDVKCRKNGVKILAGEYECSYFVANFPWEMDGEIYDDRRVVCARITHTDFIGYVKENPGKKEEIAYIGVDAGMAGFFENKPDFSNEGWSRFCDTVYHGRAWIFPYGFCTSSGFGDGGYPVFALKNETGIIVMLQIVFIDEEDED